MQLPCQPVTRLLLLWWKGGTASWLLCNNEESQFSISIPVKFAWALAGFNNSPRCQRAPLCHPAYGPLWWHDVRGAWPGVCVQGPVYWCQDSLGHQDAALLLGPLARGLALPLCAAMLTVQPAWTQMGESQGDKTKHKKPPLQRVEWNLWIRA